MELHRVGSQADWDSVPVRERNSWQQLAAWSHGAVTPGNAATLTGAIIIGISIGLLVNHLYWWALLAIAIGRICDLLDGWLAESTGTKSKLGELLDASVDKAATLAVIAALGVTAVVPWWLLATLVVVQLMISWRASFNYLRTDNQHPARSGKLSMAAVWLSLAAFVLASASNFVHVVVLCIAYAAALASVALGMLAYSGYSADRKA